MKLRLLGIEQRLLLLIGFGETTIGFLLGRLAVVRVGLCLQGFSSKTLDVLVEQGGGACSVAVHGTPQHRIGLRQLLEVVLPWREVRLLGSILCVDGVVKASVARIE